MAHNRFIFHGFVMAKSSVILNHKGEHFTLPENEINHSARATMTDMDSISVSQVLSSMEMPARSRVEIYQRYLYMLGDPIIGQALNLHVTQSLGGHETTGDVIFIEAKSDISANERKLVEQIQVDLSELINSNAYQMALWGCAFGDAYSRLFGQEKAGITHIELSDFYLPTYVQAFEKSGNTVGYQINIEHKTHVLSAMQLARLKMPRMGFTPQHRMKYNYLLQSIVQDDLSEHKPIPSNIGGSFLEMAEKPFFLLQTALLGLNSARILDNIRESMLGLNLRDMTKEQQTQFINNLKKIFQQSKQRAAQAIAQNKPILEKITHIFPVWDEKQLVSIDASGSLNAGNGQAYNIDDVMFYAKLLAGALGIDLSMLGFADLLSGGLGDGGFFRVSAQSGQRARLLRQGMTSWVNHLIDVHCMLKFGGIFDTGKRPYEVVFNGATSALERENQEIRERKSAAAAVALQNFAAVKELGLDENSLVLFLKNEMGYDEDDAKIYAKSLIQNNNDNEAAPEMM